MRYVIDGDNLLGTWSGRSRAHEEKVRLVRELARFAQVTAGHVVVVFDGPRFGVDAPPAVEVRFAARGSDGDRAVLEDVTAAAGRSRSTTVVTSDKALGDRCRHLGARVVRSHRFRPMLRAATEGAPPG